MAIANSPVRVDALLCLSTPDETEALLANLRGDPDIYHPPTFMKETMPVGHRAIVEQFHEAHIEATLTADVPSCVPLRKNISHEAVDLKVAADAWASAAATDPGIGTMVQATVWLRVLELDGEMDTQRNRLPTGYEPNDQMTNANSGVTRADAPATTQKLVANRERVGMLDDDAAESTLWLTKLATATTPTTAERME
ncbi:hypothetical protein PC122_g10930 [Phytophthora cactorum]|nr:hypothetical protein PC122_g10930 [Phytophthora cactorum]